MAKKKEQLENVILEEKDKKKTTSKEKKDVGKEEKSVKDTKKSEESKEVVKSTTKKSKSKKENNSDKTKKSKSKSTKEEVVKDKDSSVEVEVKNKKNNQKEKKEKSKKKELRFGPIEFAFNFISLVFVICVGIYFGGRSFYYYSLQNRSTKDTAMTLNGLVLDNNKLVTGEVAGLHQDKDGYFFKGNVENNYVWFANRMFRIMRVSEDNYVKLVSDDLTSSFIWGNTEDYASSNVRNWLTKVDKNEYSGVYYNTIPGQGRFLASTKYYIDYFMEDKYISGDVEFNDYVTTLTLGDYVTAGGKNSYLNNGKLFFLLGYNEDKDNLYIEEDGSIASCSNYDGFGVRSVITLNKNLPVSQGDGTKDNPYMIEQGNDVNYVDSYVKLGEDVWKVYEDKNGLLKMYLNGYIVENGEEVYKNYSLRSSKLNFFDDNNVGSYLYNVYINTLSYRNILVDNTYAYGEMSDETGYDFSNIYSKVYTAPISMLNLFDYVSGDVHDFFRNNTGASMSTTQYSVLENGLVEEAEVTDYKHIVPVVSIKSSSIKSGNGRIDNPYVVE